MLNYKKKIQTKPLGSWNWRVVFFSKVNKKTAHKKKLFNLIPLKIAFQFDNGIIKLKTRLEVNIYHKQKVGQIYKEKNV